MLLIDVVNRCRAGLQGALLLCVAGWLFGASSTLAAAQALEGKRYYRIEAQPLPVALLDFARQSELQILFRTENLPQQPVAAVEGHYTPESLLRQLLRGSGLDFVIEQQVAVIVPATANAAPSSVEAETLPPVSYSNNRIEEVEVSGIRSSLKRSLARKRSSQAVMDVITAEDIGQFPDKNVADALQRIPGISVDRIWGEGRDINIRGTDKDVNRTLMNGQNVASAYWWANDNPSRGFNYSMLASELVASLEVHKSPSADLDEGSIGGTVMIRTRRPMDLESGSIKVSIEGLYSELPDKWDPQGSLLGSWKNSRETFAALGSIYYQSRHLRRDGLEAFPDDNRYSFVDQNGQRYDNVHVPWGMGSAIFQQQRERLTGNLTLQWQSLDGLDVVFNSVYSHMDMDNQNQNYLSIPGGFKFVGDAVPQVINPQLSQSISGERSLIGGVVGDAESPGAAIDAIFRESFVETAVYDLDGNYDWGDAELHWQLGLTRAEGGSEHDRLYRFVGDSRQQYFLDRDRVEFSFPEINPQQAQDLNRLSTETHDWIRNMQDSERYAQLDYQWRVDAGWFERFKVGLKWRDHRIENSRIRGEIDQNHPLWAQAQNFGLDSVSTGLTPRLHERAASDGSLTRYAWVDENLTEQTLQPLFDAGQMQYQFDRGAYYQIEEQIRAFYWRGDFAVDDNWRGDVGLRAVHTEQASKAWQQDVPIAHRRSYRDVLPNINVVYQAADDVLLRAAAAQVMARPTFPNLTPSVIIDATDGTASGGNPELDPFRANQWELGAEWYFGENAMLAATWFYKDLSTFVFTRRAEEVVDGERVLVARPQNGPGADIQGLELQWQQSWLSGFGLLANYTYTDAQVPSDKAIDSLNLPGNSRDQINISGYYENDVLSARLSWNYRSESFGGFATGSQDVTEAYDQLDATVRFNLNEHLTASVEAVNLLNEVVVYRTASGLPQGIYENGRRLSLGLRLAL